MGEGFGRFQSGDGGDSLERVEVVEKSANFFGVVVRLISGLFQV